MDSIVLTRTVYVRYHTQIGDNLLNKYCKILKWGAKLYYKIFDPKYML